MERTRFRDVKQAETMQSTLQQANSARQYLFNQQQTVSDHVAEAHAVYAAIDTLTSICDRR